MSGRAGGSDAPTPGPTVVLDGVEVGEEFRADERLVRTGALAIRVVRLRGRAVSIGAGMRLDVPSLDRVRGAGLPIVRRSSGGTAVLHEDGDLAWSVVLPRAHPLVGRDFVRAYARIGAGVVRWLAESGMSADWVPAPGVARDFCVLSARGEVLRAGGRILGGAAQHLTAGALLHQGMVARTVDREAITALFDVARSDADRRLTSLTELGVPTTSGDARRLADAIEAAVRPA